LRRRCSSGSLRISPLHPEFHAPLRPSSPAVWKAPSRVSREISPSTRKAAYAPFTPSNSGQRSPPTYYRGCWHVVSRGFFPGYRHPARRPASPPGKGLYNPRAFLTHAALLRQPCGHCAKFLTAASRRSLGRVAVPVWLIILSDQRPIVALVARHPTNQLIGRGPLPRRPEGLSSAGPRPRTVRGISRPFGRLSPSSGWIAHAFLSRPPLPPPSRAGAVRLACFMHAASVYPEPGSNSPASPGSRSGSP